MAGSAQRPKKSESRDGCVSRILSLQLQKSPIPDFEEKCGNSSDISKGISQLGMCKFESSEVGPAVFRKGLGSDAGLRKSILVRCQSTHVHLAKCAPGCLVNFDRLDYARRPALGGFCFRLRRFYEQKRACYGLSAPRQLGSRVRADV
jgi:hypothetical protein